MTLKNGFGQCSLFVSSANGWKDQDILFVFPPMKTLIWRRHCSISQSCCSMTSKRSIDWFLESSSGIEFFSAERSLNQPKATHVCIRSINQSNRSISVRFMFLFCPRVFISRSYENRSNLNYDVSYDPVNFLVSGTGVPMKFRLKFFKKIPFCSKCKLFSKKFL